MDNYKNKPESHQMPSDRRQFLGMTGAGLVGASLPAVTPACASPAGGSPHSDPASRSVYRGPGEHKLPDLPYAKDALEPYYDTKTVELHHGVHHLGYVNGLNAAEKQAAEMGTKGDFAAMKSVAKALAFHGSGHLLHSIFWTNMQPKGGGQPEGDLAKRIERDFGSYKAFAGMFLAASNSAEGSGWGVLAHDRQHDVLRVLQAEKHENFAIWGVTPILVCDVWEHAYYLKYQNRRPDYLAAWWNVVNWDAVNKRFKG